MKLFLKLKGFITAAGIPGMLLLFNPVLIVLVTRSRDTSYLSQVDASSVFQIVFLVGCTLVVFRELFYFKQVLLKKMLINSPFKYFLFFNAICFLSAFWSPNVLLTIYRSFECLVFLLLITITVKKLIQQFSYTLVIKWTIWYAFWNLFVGILLRLKIIGLLSISIPFLASRLFFPLFFFIIIIMGNRLLPKIITAAIVLLGFSNKIFIGVALGFLSFIYGSVRSKIFIIISLLVISFPLMYFGLDELLLNTLFYGRDSVGLEDASGRKQLWTYLLNKGYESPYFGYGFVAGESELISKVSIGAINSHNSIISAFINVGALGMISLVLFFISVFKTTYTLKVKNKKTKVAFLASIILVIVVSLSSPGIGGRVYGSWIPSIFIISLIIGSKKHYSYVP